MLNPTKGRVTVPVLWDRVRETTLSNESSGIIRMINSAFGGLSPVKTDYYPPELKDKFDEIIVLIYAKVNNGLYRCGFATTQEA